MRRNKHELLFEEFATDVTRRSEVDYIETPVSTKIFTGATIAAGLVIVLLFGRLLYLNLLQKSFYVARAVTNVDLDRPIPAQRGTITDRYGEVLAKNTDT